MVLGPVGFDTEAVRDLEYTPRLLAGLTALEAAREPGFEGTGGTSSAIWSNLFTRSFNDDCLDLDEEDNVGFDFAEVRDASLFEVKEEDR